MAQAAKPTGTHKWIVQNLSSEVSIVRENFYHGRVSQGWGGKDKKIIANVYIPKMMDAAMQLAEKIALEMNILEDSV